MQAMLLRNRNKTSTISKHLAKESLVKINCLSMEHLYLLSKILGSSNHVLKNQNNVFQYQNRFKQNQPSSSNVFKPVPRAPPVSIADKDDLMDSDDDEILLIASQRGEEEERRMNEKRQQMSEEINMSINNFSQFIPNKQPTSTQMTQRPDPIKSGYTEKISKELFTNFPAPSQHQLESTQKENITLTQTLTLEKNKTKALEIQLRNQKQTNSDLQERLTKKEGENSNLRREKKLIDQQYQTLRIKTNSEPVRVDAAKDELLKKIRTLESKLQFKELNETNLRKTAIASTDQPKSSIPSFMNFSHQSKSRALQVSKKVFDMKETQFSLSSDVNLMHQGSSNDVLRIQLRLAQVNAMLLAGGHLGNDLLDNLFHDAVVMIIRICDFIDYLEFDEEEEICYDSDPGLTACAMISLPMWREKLTIFDPIKNAIDKDEGFLSIFQADKLYEEELCSKPRRIIACIATLARSSRVFSEKLLLESVSIEDTDEHQTFVSILISRLASKVTQSKRVYDYWGLAIASSSLLASLGSHFKHYHHNTVDGILLKFFRSVLECRCDSPLMMQYVSEFLVHITSNGNSSEMVSSLCTLYPRDKIISSNTYKYSDHPPNACYFQLFTMYLLTAFNFDTEMNRNEFDILAETAGNVNKITLNMQATDCGTLKFLNWDEKTDALKICKCFSMLTYSLIFLNHQVLTYRNFSFKNVVQAKLHASKLEADECKLLTDVGELLIF